MCSFWIYGSCVVNPIIHGLIPRPSRYEIRQLNTNLHDLCRLQPGKSVGIALLERKKVYFDHSGCLRCQRGNGAPVACKDVAVAESSVRFNSFKGLILPWAEQASRAKAQGAHETNKSLVLISRRPTCNVVAGYNWQRSAICSSGSPAHLRWIADVPKLARNASCVTLKIRNCGKNGITTTTTVYWYSYIEILPKIATNIILIILN